MPGCPRSHWSMSSSQTLVSTFAQRGVPLERTNSLRIWKSAVSVCLSLDARCCLFAVVKIASQTWVIHLFPISGRLLNLLPLSDYFEAVSWPTLCISHFSFHKIHQRSTVKSQCTPGRETPSISLVRSRLIPAMCLSCGSETGRRCPTPTPPTLRSSGPHPLATFRYTLVTPQFPAYKISTLTHAALMSSSFHEDRLDVRGFLSAPLWGEKIQWIIQQQECSHSYKQK